MPKVLFSAVSIIVLLLPGLAIPTKISARSCPVKMPETLLSLYKSSESIYVARYDKTEVGDTLREDENFTVISIKKHFDVSSTLKGANQKLFVLEEDEYRYKAPPTEYEAPEEGTKESAVEEAEQAEDGEFDADEEEISQLKTGDTVLLFLRKDDAGKTVLTDYRDGLKKLPQEDLRVYEKRIEELNSIFGADEVSDEAIVEWLVRCAEDAATRWEGTYELLRSFQRLDWQEERAKEKKEKGENEEAEEENVVYYGSFGEINSGDTTVYAELLNYNQKQILSNILLNGDFSSPQDGKKKRTLNRGDRELIDLVKRWGDSRLVGFLLDRLRNDGNDPYENSQMMDTVAELLDDKEVSSIAEKYSNIYYESDDGEVEEEKEEAESEETDVEQSADGSEPSVDPQKEIVEDNAGDTEDQPDAVKSETKNTDIEKPKVTYKQLREELLAKFLDRSERVLAKEKGDTVDAK